MNEKQILRGNRLHGRVLERGGGYGSDSSGKLETGQCQKGMHGESPEGGGRFPASDFRQSAVLSHAQLPVSERKTASH